MSLRDAWDALFDDEVPAAAEAGDALIEAWSEPQRRYHTTAHLERMLSIVDARPHEADDARAVRLACWFHDAVYDPAATDNEIRSAELAAATLRHLGEGRSEVAEVVRLVYLTASHRVEDGDRNGALLCDADLAILAAPREDYDAYAAAIRDEYRHVPDDAYRAGRIAILGRIAELPEIYRLQSLREQWEDAARANMAREVSALRAGAGADPTP